MGRFDRQIALPGFGTAGQERLASARVAIVGMGGLGCPALLYLAAAGVGFIRIIDGDRVQESNLNRQVLFGQEDIGKYKAEAAAERIRRQFPDVRTEAVAAFLEAGNASELLSDCDLVLDCSDTIETRYLLDDTCLALGLPWIMGAIYGNEGMLALWNAPPEGEPPILYRHLYPTAPDAAQLPACDLTGVLGVLPGTIGTAQAAAAIRWICAYGDAVQGKVKMYHLLEDAWYSWQVKPGADTQKPDAQLETQPGGQAVQVITWQEAEALRQNQAQAVWVDLREWHEREEEETKALHWPGGDISLRPQELEHCLHIVLICRSGKRSLQLGRHLSQQEPFIQYYSVSGGWDARKHPSPETTHQHPSET
jgi:adenylyltransferase/sulfurtransferase